MDALVCSSITVVQLLILLKHKQCAIIDVDSTFIIIILLTSGLNMVTIFINTYLYYCTVQCNKKLRENMRLDGGNQHEINRIKRILHNLRMQVKPTMSVLILGGIDIILNASQILYFLASLIFYI